MKKKGKIHVGTSGWHYKHWKGRFYPEGAKDSEQLKLYVKDFSTVEINNSFYKLPSAKTFGAWKAAVPKGFVFAVKVSRFITHMKKLNVGKATINKFLHRVDHLEGKTGPILFQLPPRWKMNTGRLEKLFQQLPKGYRYTFEFRDTTWYDETVYELLRRYNIAFCIYELEFHISPKIVTADFVYIRLHGPGKKYQGKYSMPTLKKWAKDCKIWQKEGRDVYVYFDNDQLGYAPLNGRQLVKLTSTA